MASCKKKKLSITSKTLRNIWEKLTPQSDGLCCTTTAAIRHLRSLFSQLQISKLWSKWFWNSRSSKVCLKIYWLWLLLKRDKFGRITRQHALKIWLKSVNFSWATATGAKNMLTKTWLNISKESLKRFKTSSTLAQPKLVAKFKKCCKLWKTCSYKTQ